MNYNKLTAGLAAAAAVLLLCTPVQAAWQYSASGPGTAVWTNTETGEKVSAAAGQAAPDGTGAPASGVTSGGGTVSTSGGGPGMNLSSGTSEKNTAGAADQTDNSSGTAAQQTGELQAGAQTADVQKAGTQATGEQAAGTQQPAEGTEDGSRIYLNGRWIDRSRPMVALTYDDGPYAPVGNAIMDICAANGARVTFFIVGNRINAYRAEVERMAREGHEVANHSWDHTLFHHLDAAGIRQQVARTNEAIAAVTGTAPALLRLPGGRTTDTVRQNVSMPMIYWSVDTQDWKTKNAQATIQAVVGRVKDGDIVLMHEIWSSTGSASATIIPALTSQGYQLVTVSELIRLKGASAPGGNGKQYSRF